MLTALAILGVLAALFLAAALATREGEALAPAAPDAADLELPEGPVRADDVRGLRFGLAARGYRMSEVDTALARIAADLEARDARIAELEGGTGAPTAAPTAPSTAPVPVVEPDLEREPDAVAVPPAPAATDAAFGAELAFPEVAPPEEADEQTGGDTDGSAPQAPDLAVGQAPVEPVDPPVRSAP